jgi:hypothetical protein
MTRLILLLAVVGAVLALAYLEDLLDGELG